MQFHREAFIEILDRSAYPSRKAFADAVGISPGSLHDVEHATRGRKPSDELLHRFARELKCPVTALIRDPADQAVPDPATARSTAA